MNNNGFALLRYFRDLEIDAHLLLFSNDGKGDKDHFDILADTNYPEKWFPFIHQTDICNSEETIAGSKYKFMLWGLPLYLLRWILQCMNLQKKKIYTRINKRNVLKEISDYSHFIGCGISPAILYIAGLKLDIFYPYSIGVEFYGTSSFENKYKLANGAKKKVLIEAKFIQSLGIKNSRFVFCSQSNYEDNSFKKMGIKHHNIMLPCVYLEKNSLRIDKHANKYKTKRLNFLHSARLFWQKPTHYNEQQWELENKNNQWFIEEFAKASQAIEGKYFHLYIIEYGPNIKETKLLVESLGITENVTWLKKMKRKDILSLLHDEIHVSVGEFYKTSKMIWGGTGWEAFATGTPLLQGFNFTEDEFSKQFGFESPGFIKVRAQECINLFFNELRQDRVDLFKISNESLCWFNRYNGLELSKKWLTYLMN